jgi:hypothetical protein
MLGLEIFNIFSTGLLVMAILKLRYLCRNFQTLNESRLVVGVTLIIFTLENISLTLSLAISYVYVKRNEPKLYDVALNCHFAALVAASSLLIFFAFVIIELSKSKEEVEFQV